jgi:phage anti-repressor protein
MLCALAGPACTTVSQSWKHQINKGVQVGQEVIQTVNARELHGFLQNNKASATWIKERIEKYGFQDGIAYRTTTNLPNREISTGGRRLTEYHVSISMAKELTNIHCTCVASVEHGKRNIACDNMERHAEAVAKELWEMLRPER